MKFLVIVILLVAVPAYSAISEVSLQRKSADSAASVASFDITFAVNVTVGNLICVGGGFYNGTSDATVVVSDSRSTAFSTYFGTFEDNGYYTYIACGKVPSSGANTITITPSVDSYIGAAIDEFSGQDLGSFLDVDGGSNNGTDDLAQPSIDITTVADNALILGVMAHGKSGSTTLDEPVGSTLVGEQESNACCQSYSFVFEIVGTGGLQTLTWNMNDTSGWTWFTYAISVKPATGGGAAVRHKAIIIE